MKVTRDEKQLLLYTYYAPNIKLLHWLSYVGETCLVEHDIKLTDNIPVMAQPRCLPYALCNELERELDWLISSEHIEPSNRIYSSAWIGTSEGAWSV